MYQHNHLMWQLHFITFILLLLGFSYYYYSGLHSQLHSWQRRSAHGQQRVNLDFFAMSTTALSKPIAQGTLRRTSLLTALRCFTAMWRDVRLKQFTPRVLRDTKRITQRFASATFQDVHLRRTLLWNSSGTSQIIAKSLWQFTPRVLRDTKRITQRFASATFQDVHLRRTLLWNSRGTSQIIAKSLWFSSAAYVTLLSRHLNA